MYSTQFREWLQGKSGDPATLLSEFRQYLEAQGVDLADVDDAELQAVLDEGDEPESPAAVYSRLLGKEVFETASGGFGVRAKNGRVVVGDQPDEEMTEYALTSEPNNAKKAWDESKHPRGDSENSGRFGSGGGGTAQADSSSEQQAAEPESPRVQSAREANDDDVVDMSDVETAPGDAGYRDAEPNDSDPDETERYFGDVMVPAKDLAEVEAAMQHIWPDGNVKIEDIKGLVGGPKDMKLTVTAMQWGRHGGNRIIIGGASGAVEDMGRSISRERDGSLVMHNNIFVLHDSLKGKKSGVGTEIFTSQVADCLSKGFNRIECTAARHDSDKEEERLVGYIVWPKLGYDGPIPDKVPRPPELASAQTVNELMALPGGEDWWKQNGSDFKGTFDLSPGSASLTKLNAYLEKKGKPPIAVPQKPAAKPEEPKLSSRAERMLAAARGPVQGLRGTKAIAEFEAWLVGKDGSDAVLLEEYLRLKAVESAFKGKGSAKGDGGGRWVTIGASGGHGGTPVFIKGGKIEKGPASVSGKKVDSIDKHPDSTKTSDGEKENPAVERALKPKADTIDSTSADMGGSGDKPQASKPLDAQQQASPVEANVPNEMIDAAGEKRSGEPNDAIPQSLEPGMGATTPPPEQEVTRALMSEPGSEPVPDEGVPRALVNDEAGARKVAAQEKASKAKQEASDKQTSDAAYRQDARAATKEQKAAIFAQAEAAGIAPAHVQERAAGYREIHNAHVERVNSLLKTVRQMTARETKGGLNKLSKKQRELAGGKQNANYQSLNSRTVQKVSESGKEVSTLKGIKQLASELASEYSDLLGPSDTAGAGANAEDVGDVNDAAAEENRVVKLQELLIAGNQQPMSEQQALEEALTHLEEEKDLYGGGGGQFPDDHDPFADEVGAPNEEANAAGDSPDSGADTSFDFGENAPPPQAAKRGVKLASRKADKLRGITGKALETAKWDILTQEHIVPLYGAERAAAVSDAAMLNVFHGNGTLKDIAAAYRKALVDTDSYRPDTWQAMGDGYLDLSMKRYGMTIAGRDEDEEEEIERGKPTRYAVRAPGVYSPCAEPKIIKPLLPAGLYDAHMTPAGAVFKARTIQVDSLIGLAGSLPDQILDEIDAFWEKGKNFSRYGFLHRRGYMLWGKPGTGKSALVYQIIDGIVKKGNVAFFCQNPHSFMMCMAEFREVEPDRPMVCLFEDIDSIINHYGDEALLQWLDGNHMVNRVVSIATTNYPDRLDPRIVSRPRRFDRVLEIEAPDEAMRNAFFAKKVPDLSAAERQQWVTATDGLTFAALSEVVISVLCLENDLHETVERLRMMDRRVPISNLR